MGLDKGGFQSHPQASAYFGLASIFMAATFLSMAVPALDLANTLQRSNYAGFNESERKLAAIGGYVGGGAVVLLCAIAAGFAMGGFRAARRTGEHPILCVAGLLLSLFATLVWVGCLASWHSQAARFLGG